MATAVVLLSIEGGPAAHAFDEARKLLEGTQHEVVLDFASVVRIDSRALRALNDLAEVARGSGKELILSNVSVDIYKVLKLAGLTPRFFFRT